MSAGRRRVGRLTTGALLSTALAACNGTTSYLDATGSAGRAEGTLGWWLTVVASVVVLFVCVAVLAGVARHRGERNAPTRDAADEPGDEGAGAHRREVRSGLGWIYVGLAVTVVVLLVTFAGTMVTLNAASHPPRTPALTMDVIGHQWWWEVRYGDPAHPDFAFTTANEVHLPVGEPVRVRLHSADVIHSFWLPQIAGKTDVIPGQVNETWLEARQPGTSRGMCAEYCGLQHAVMALAVTAESPAEFARWAQSRRAPAAAPTAPEAQAGQVVFARTCGVCHAVAGTNALGRLGPDLTHLASRPTIGAGMLANTPTNLASWITNAPGLKEGARMPAIPLDGDQLRAVVAYLRTLR
ncbi:MAG TPA: cytochrome c oxidase subunit II [Gemmatimonadaceae bacterium]|nr:cytochrome c oxidase subunit II [Gemmatimonadaceae bacterium]